MDKIIFISIEEVVVIHEKMIEIGGGSESIRDIESIHYSVERPKATFVGKYLHQSILDMGSALLQSLVKNHPFVDGNKRTAFFSALRFFDRNGKKFKLDSSEITEFMVKVVAESLTVGEISQWFEERLKNKD